MKTPVNPGIPQSLETHLRKPYGGLFGSSVLAQVVEEIVSDPTMDYRPGYLEELTGASAPPVREALATLVGLGLLVRSGGTGRHPVYRVNVAGKKFAALSLLAYAIIDDREGTDCMDQAVHEYYGRVLRKKYEPIAVATRSSYHVGSHGQGQAIYLHEGRGRYAAGV